MNATAKNPAKQNKFKIIALFLTQKHKMFVYFVIKLKNT